MVIYFAMCGALIAAFILLGEMAYRASKDMPLYWLMELLNSAHKRSLLSAASWRADTDTFVATWEEYTFYITYYFSGTYWGLGGRCLRITRHVGFGQVELFGVDGRQAFDAPWSARWRLFQSIWRLWRAVKQAVRQERLAKRASRRKRHVLLSLREGESI